MVYSTTTRSLFGVVHCCIVSDRLYTMDFREGFSGQSPENKTVPSISANYGPLGKRFSHVLLKTIYQTFRAKFAVFPQGVNAQVQNGY